MTVIIGMRWEPSREPGSPPWKGKYVRGECRTCHFAKWAAPPRSVEPRIACLRFPAAVYVDPQRQGERVGFVCSRMPPEGWCGEYLPSDTGEPLPYEWRLPGGA